MPIHPNYMQTDADTDWVSILNGDRDLNTRTLSRNEREKMGVWTS